MLPCLWILCIIPVPPPPLASLASSNPHPTHQQQQFFSQQLPIRSIYTHVYVYTLLLSLKALAQREARGATE
ncbi:MAG: hypothetical protein J3Q66DRAFT_357264 [Benniella sp.]|nr:MAG: hypothetical protein J3Q66DRAFT_357264 [Benniella sp.]